VSIFVITVIDGRERMNLTTVTAVTLVHSDILTQTKEKNATPPSSIRTAALKKMPASLYCLHLKVNQQSDSIPHSGEFPTPTHTPMLLPNHNLYFHSKQIGFTWSMVLTWLNADDGAKGGW